MAEYVELNEPLIFENKTDSSFNVAAGIIFRKSGLYQVSVGDKYVSVEFVGEKRGKWKRIEINNIDLGQCS